MPTGSRASNKMEKSIMADSVGYSWSNTNIYYGIGDIE